MAGSGSYRRDSRSPEATAYRRLYKTKAWQAIRQAQLAAHPLCEMCLKVGRITPATICDHDKPHKGDPVAFHAGPFTSLCKPHHDSAKQREERGVKVQAAGVDGWPIE